MKGYTITEQENGFVFHMIITEEYLKKSPRALRMGERKVMFAFAFFGLLALVGLLSLLQVITLFNNFMSSMLILYAVLFCCIQSQSERRTVHRLMERCAAHEPADVEREYTFGDEILSYSPVTGSRKSFPYAELKDFRVTKDAFLFLLNGATFVSVPKGCFAAGQAERFEHFVRGKLGR